MKTEIGYHHTLLHVEFPDTSIIYRSSCAPPTASASELVLEAVRNQACPIDKNFLFVGRSILSAVLCVKEI